MSMDNPFRAQAVHSQHHAHSSNSRRIWNLFFVTALGLSMLWLSWTLLLDDSDDAAIHSSALVDEEEATRILSKETRLRTNPADLGEIDEDLIKSSNKKKKSKKQSKEKKEEKTSSPTLAPTHEDDDEDDEHENIGDEDHHDEDTLTHDERIQRQIEQRQAAKDAAEKQDAKAEAKTDDDELDHLSPEELKKLAAEDHHDEAEMEHPRMDTKASNGDHDNEENEVSGDDAVSNDAVKFSKDTMVESEDSGDEEEAFESNKVSTVKDDDDDTVSRTKKQQPSILEPDDVEEPPMPPEHEHDDDLRPNDLLDLNHGDEKSVKPSTSSAQKSTQKHVASFEEEEDEIKDLKPRESSNKNQFDDEEVFDKEHAKKKLASLGTEEEDEEPDAPPAPLLQDDDDIIHDSNEDEYLGRPNDDESAALKRPAVDQTKSSALADKHVPAMAPEDKDLSDEGLEEDPFQQQRGITVPEEKTNNGLFAIPPEKPLRKVTDTEGSNSMDEDDLLSALHAEEDEEDDSIPRGKKLDESTDSANPRSTLPCDMIRKKTECDERHECKWKYPKSQLTGFYCVERETCEDEVSQKKSHCLSLPKCAWVRVSHSAYGCRTAGTPEHESKEDNDLSSGLDESGSAIDHIPGECEVHERKSKCLATTGCSWMRISTAPTKYGCRVTKVGDNDSDEEEQTVIAEETGNGELVQSDEGGKPSLPMKSTVNTLDVPEADDNDDDEDAEDDDTDDTDEDTTETESVAKSTSPQTVCSSIRLKSACQMRTDCYWKYPVSYSSGKYCVERRVSVKVEPEKAAMYESLANGKIPLYDDSKLQPLAASPRARFKIFGPDWKRYRGDTSCALHPECLARENVTTDFYPGFPSLDIPPTYVRAQCCASHPDLRSLFFLVTEFLNREGIPWWLSAKDSLQSLFADGYMLPWTSQITIEVAIFGSKSATEYASSKELRANMTSYATTRTRVLRSTKNEFASKLLNFNADALHPPNTMSVCASKFVPGSKSASKDSYSGDWLRSEVSGTEQCLIVSKSSKLSSSRTPTHFIVSHLDHIEGKGPSIKIVPRIFRTASSDSCLELWRPSTDDFAAIPLRMVFPTVPCFGHGKFQGFTGVARCPRDAKSFLAWELAASGDPRFLSKEVSENVDEFRKWLEADYCSRGIPKIPS